MDITRKIRQYEKEMDGALATGDVAKMMYASTRIASWLDYCAIKVVDLRPWQKRIADLVASAGLHYEMTREGAWIQNLLSN